MIVLDGNFSITQICVFSSTLFCHQSSLILILSYHSFSIINSSSALLIFTAPSICQRLLLLHNHHNHFTFPQTNINPFIYELKILPFIGWFELFGSWLHKDLEILQAISWKLISHLKVYVKMCDFCKCSFFKRVLYFGKCLYFQELKIR